MDSTSLSLKPAMEKLKALQPITFPLLIPCEPGEEDGAVQEVGEPETVRAGTGDARLFLFGRSIFRPVKKLSARELDPKKIKKILSKEEWDFLTGVSTITHAYRREDMQLAESGYRLLAPSIFPGEMVAQGAHLQYQHIFGHSIPSATSMQAAAQYMSGLVSKALRDARLVYWRVGKYVLEEHPKPPMFDIGLLCPDYRTALSVRLLLNAAMRVCPQCQNVFRVTRKNSTCCSARHANAYRVAQCRERQKRKNHEHIQAR